MRTLKFEITEEAFNLLKEIEKRPAEYRDPEFSTLEDFQKSDTSGFRTDDSFLNRNNGGTLYLVDELSEKGLVEPDGESWNLTYVISHFGKEILKINK
jgi:hypothetical protein